MASQDASSIHKASDAGSFSDRDRDKDPEKVGPVAGDDTSSSEEAANVGLHEFELAKGVRVTAEEHRRWVHICSRHESR